MWIQVGNLIIAALQSYLTSLDAIKTILGVKPRPLTRGERASFKSPLSLYWRVSCKSANPFFFLVPIHRQAEAPFPSGVAQFQIYSHFFPISPLFPSVFSSCCRHDDEKELFCQSLIFFNFFFNDKSAIMQIMPPNYQSESTILGITIV